MKKSRKHILTFRSNKHSIFSSRKKVFQKYILLCRTENFQRFQKSHLERRAITLNPSYFVVIMVILVIFELFQASPAGSLKERNTYMERNFTADHKKSILLKIRKNHEIGQKSLDWNKLPLLNAQNDSVFIEWFS